jgi:hypothetical protein
VTLRIQFPDMRHAEFSYIIEVLVGDFLGLDCHAAPAPRRTLSISIDEDASGRELTVDCPFLQTPEHDWLRERSLPSLPLPRLDLADLPFAVASHATDLPVLFGERIGDAWWASSDSCAHLGVDVFGASFFMLTRYEEIANVARDDHDRFPATAAIAMRAGFLDRPIVNEYVELLWGALHHLWPRLERKKRAPRTFVSHDVDWPLVTRGVPLRQVARSALGDVASRRDPALAARRLLSRFHVSRGQLEKDLGNTFEFIMDESEKRGLRSAFYFITDHTAGLRDGSYSMDDPWIRALMRRMHDRGHEIGLHPSYNTFRDAGQTRREFERLLEACDAEGIRQAVWGGRQHYLRWSNPDTWVNWDQAGLDYDSTLSFADCVGFRTGVCYEYPVFDLRDRRRLRLRERPLLIMEATLFETASPVYMALSDEDGVAMVKRSREVVHRFSGDLTLLWHNSSLISARQRELYRRVVNQI